jgi:hypothetical protein
MQRQAGPTVNRRECCRASFVVTFECRERGLIAVAYFNPVMRFSGSAPIAEASAPRFAISFDEWPTWLDRRLVAIASA